MTSLEVAALIERALTLIDEDDPDFGAPLATLATAEGLAALQAEPERARSLFTELRKLRPLPLWAAGRVERALADKRDLVLDGAICTLDAGTAVLRPEGRECWLEVAADEAESTLRSLPPGWGLLVHGDLAQVSFSALRRASPLRALGARLGPVQTFSEALAEARLDLVVTPDPTRGQGLGARVLWSVHSPEMLRLAPDATPGIGVLCDAAEARLYALLLATMRRGRPPSR